MTDELFTAVSTLAPTTWTQSCKVVEYSAKQFPASHSCEDRLRVDPAMVTAPPLPSNGPHPGVAWRSGLDQKAQTGALKLGFEPNRGISQSGPIQGLNLPKPLATRAVHHRSSRPKTMGVTYYTYRYYDPVTGRWPSKDPIGERGGINLYGFVRNGGINRWDLLGLEDPACKCEADKGNYKGISFTFTVVTLWDSYDVEDPASQIINMLKKKAESAPDDGDSSALDKAKEIAKSATTGATKLAKVFNAAHEAQSALLVEEAKMEVSFKICLESEGAYEWTDESASGFIQIGASAITALDQVQEGIADTLVAAAKDMAEKIKKAKQE